MNAYLDIDHVSITFPTDKGPLNVLSDVNLKVQQGEFISLIGHSGCGKSTVLNIVAGLLQASQGGVVLEGREVTDPGPDRAVVFQNHSLLPWLSVYDNVTLSPKLTGVKKKAELDEIAERCLRRAALWDEVKDRLHALGSLLSGGQQQRLTIARALSQDPQLLLLDEFSIAVDPVTTMRIEDVLKELRGEMTIVMVTNLVQQARRLAHRTAFFLNGELVEVGNTEEFFTGEVRDSRTREYVEGKFG